LSERRSDSDSDSCSCSSDLPTLRLSPAVPAARELGSLGCDRKSRCRNAGSALRVIGASVREKRRAEWVFLAPRHLSMAVEYNAYAA